ncbi:MAG: tRNA preQ1(34) S-adenosylmethionine ribosyltransferase-isomerase QueA [Zavarzinella sp.]
MNHQILDQLDYELPMGRIAQFPAEHRDHSKLLPVVPGGQNFRHLTFNDLPSVLRSGDLLVMNTSRVVPARILGRRAKTGGKWEGLFLHENADGTWEILAQTRGKPELGEKIELHNSHYELELVGRNNGHWIVKPTPPGPAWNILLAVGHIPLPPYIRKGIANAEDEERYQTVYAREPGSVAAPTAGLHFTTELLAQLRAMGVGTTSVTLHVGIGTFASVDRDEPEKFQMHHEWCEVPEATVEAILACRQRGNRVIAVGTTATRALEAAALAGGGTLQSWQGETDLCIEPGHQFRVIDGLITNFHLPRTTLLLLVAALAGVETTKAAYQAAIANDYRFYSYGDAMIILPSR